MDFQTTQQLLILNRLRATGRAAILYGDHVQGGSAAQGSAEARVRETAAVWVDPAHVADRLSPPPDDARSGRCTRGNAADLEQFKRRLMHVPSAPHRPSSAIDEAYASQQREEGGRFGGNSIGAILSAAGASSQG